MLRLYRQVNTGLRHLQKALQVSSLHNHVKIVEVGPRDGLQNEKTIVPTETKIEFINSLSGTGLEVIECTSFVSPRWIPQFFDNAEVMQRIKRRKGVSYPVLVPNETGFNAALDNDAKEVAIFAAASEEFSRKNINCSIDESLLRFEKVAAAARNSNIRLRGYVSCVVGCPYAGPVAPEVVLKVTNALFELGCYEVSLGDTIGVGTPGSIGTLLEHVLRDVPAEAIAIHCHDTYGQALANILTSIKMGVATVDASVAGLGGCPYANGASGNVSTEDVVYMLEGMGIETGVDLAELARIGDWISAILQRQSGSKFANAISTK